MQHFEVYKAIAKLKELERKGWVQREVSSKLGGSRIESVAEHVFSTGLFALYVIKQEKLKLDEDKVLKMILFHDIGEAYIGDIAPADKISKEKKYMLEKTAVKKFANLFEWGGVFELWQEFETAITPEAKFVKKLDKLDAVMQAKIYSEKLEDNNQLFEEFFNYGKENMGELIKFAK